jgi:hypothetical protein
VIAGWQTSHLLRLRRHVDGLSDVTKAEAKAEEQPRSRREEAKGKATGTQAVADSSGAIDAGGTAT